MSVWELPNSWNVKGLNIVKNWFPLLVSSEIDSIALDKDDVLVVAYPRTGTTWLSNILSLLRAGPTHYDECSQIPLYDRVLYLEMQKPGSDKSEIERLHEIPPPRVSKTHIPFDFASKWVTRDKVKMVIALRNPKDTLVSLYYFYKTHKALGGFPGTWDDFFTHVQAGKQIYGDQMDWMLSWWNNRHHNNLLFVKYEDMIEDLGSEIRRLANFLELDMSEEFLNTILAESRFDSMQNNSIVNYSVSGQLHPGAPNFIRRGQVGQWKEYFTVAQNEWFDTKYMKRIDKSGMGLRFE